MLLKLASVVATVNRILESARGARRSDSETAGGKGISLKKA